LYDLDTAEANLASVSNDLDTAEANLAAVSNDLGAAEANLAYVSNNYVSVESDPTLTDDGAVTIGDGSSATVTVTFDGSGTDKTMVYDSATSRHTIANETQFGSAGTPTDNHGFNSAPVPEQMLTSEFSTTIRSGNAYGHHQTFTHSGDNAGHGTINLGGRFIDMNVSGWAGYGGTDVKNTAALEIDLDDETFGMLVNSYGVKSHSTAAGSYNCSGHFTAQGSASENCAIYGSASQGAVNYGLRIETGDSYINDDFVSKTYNFGSDTGGDDAYAITLPVSPVTYTTGMMIIFSVTTANTGACTVNVNGLGAKNLLMLHDQTPADNYIEDWSIVVAVYDGVNFQMIQPDANP
jgi:hypothetical protein